MPSWGASAPRKIFQSAMVASLPPRRGPEPVLLLEVGRRACRVVPEQRQVAAEVTLVPRADRLPAELPDAVRQPGQRLVAEQPSDLGAGRVGPAGHVAAD